MAVTAATATTATTATTAATAEFRFNDRDFRRIRRLIYALAGISLADCKRQMVYTRLARRLRALGMTDFRVYLDRVEADRVVEQAFINALTTNLTAFFRESHHFPILAERLMALPSDQAISIWCAAASTGEEPYSIAITVLETLGTEAFQRVRIYASDLDTAVLKTGKEGIYPLSALDAVPGETLRRCFMRGIGAQHGFARVRPEIQGMIEFRQINLLDRYWPIRSPLDAIFCRNVMIYFDRATQRRLLERFAPLMSPDGLFFAGHSESLGHAHDLFRPLGKTVYQPAAARIPR